MAGLFCLLMLMWGDPGVVDRNPQNSMPIPAQVHTQRRTCGLYCLVAQACHHLFHQVVEKLKSGQSLDGLANIREGAPHRSGCIVHRAIAPFSRMQDARSRVPRASYRVQVQGAAFSSPVLF
jgi:hypothetical protein